MITILAFALGSAVGIALGYALAIVLVSGWSFSYAVRYGVMKALRAKDMMKMYEDAARNERELYALHFSQLVREIGGPGAPIPLTKSGLENIFRLTETRMNFDKKRRRYAYAKWSRQ